MYNIKNIYSAPLQTSSYMKPRRIVYTQNGIDRVRDILITHDSVSVLLYNVSRNVLLFVKQFRPSIYFADIPDAEHHRIVDLKKYPPANGYTIELCAGLVDKDKSLEEIAREEVLEECGYDVPVSNFNKIMSCRSVGISGRHQTVYYAEITDEMKISSGGGIEDELIELVEMTLQDLECYMKCKDLRSPSLFAYAVSWFLQSKNKIINLT